MITTAQNVTGSYADIGNVPGAPYINAMDCDSITLWIKLAINNSTGIKIRMLGVEKETDTDLYRPVTKDVSAGSVAIQPAEIAITSNSDQNIMITFPILDEIPFVKFQVMAGVVGVSPGQLVACGVTFTSEI